MGLIDMTIKRAKEDLNMNGIVRPSKKWQGVEAPYKLLEIFNRYLQFDIPESKRELAALSKANLPWAEDHFQERIAGEPLNPGNQWYNWPFYKGLDNDKLFRGEGSGEQFSHTYMERFWPPKINGIRYPMGDFKDIIERIKNDPHGRQNYFAIWHPEDQSPGDRRLPCTLGYHFQIIKGVLDCTYHIRSCDIFRHFHNDIYMTGRLMQYVVEELREQLPFLTTGIMYMWIGSLHCFEPERGLLVN